MAALLLQTGGTALIDDQDVEIVSPYKWYRVAPGRRTPSAFYVIAKPYCRLTKKQPTLWMHRLLLSPKRGEQVDHINRDGLDNRRCNLRICTQSQNNANSQHRVSSTGYRGVYRDGRRYQAAISVGGQMVRLGRFDGAIPAARAYDAAALQHFGEFASLNFPAPFGG